MTERWLNVEGVSDRKTGMELGYSITSFYTDDVADHEAARRVVERARTAEEVGYDYVEAGDQHAISGGGYLQNVPTTARLAAEIDHVATMFLLPLYDPVLVAEQVGTLDALASEFDFWCAVGGGRRQFDAFDVPLDERASRFEEALALLDRLWTADDVTFEGEFYQVDGVSINPKASPRVCIGGGAEPAVRRAGRLGDAWVAGPSEDDLPRKLDWFEAEGGGDVIVRREALALADGERARELTTQKLDDGYRGWPADADWVLAGDAETLAADLERLAELGADEVVVRPMSNTHAEETLRTVARARERL